MPFFGRRKRELAETRALLEQSKTLITQQKSQLEQLAQSYALVKYESDRYDYETVGGKTRRIDKDEQALVAEWVEAEMMGGAGVSMQRMTHEQRESQAVQIKERMWEIELALEDRGWQRQLALAQTEFSRYGLQQIILMSRLYFIKNPLIRRGVLVSSHYTFGRGVEISSDDDDANQVIRDFLNDPLNAQELGQVGLVEKDQSLHTDGNLFFVFPTNAGNGAVQIRNIDATEIVDIVTNPDDAAEPWYYKRRWVSRNFNVETGVDQTDTAEAWYPALGYESPAKTIGGKPCFTDQPILHMKCGGLSKWLFGCPEVYCSIDWARAYKNFLEDWASVNRALARFATTVETKGGVQAIQQFQKVLSTTLGQGGTSVESNPTPVTASSFITGPGNKLEAFKTSGAQNSPEQGRRMMLMVAAAFGLPETFFGDASTGSLATAQSLDRPTELKFLERQERWRFTLQRIIAHVLDSSGRAAKGKLREAWGHPRTIIMQPLRVLQGDRLVEVRNRHIREDAGDNPEGVKVTVKFPAVLEHDLAIMISAIVQAATLGGFQMGGTMDIRTAAKLLLAELGVEDPTTVLDALYPAADYDPLNYANNGKADVPDVPDGGEPPPQPGAHLVTPSFGKEALREAHLARAIDMLVAASKKMQGRLN